MKKPVKVNSKSLPGGKYNIRERAAKVPLETRLYVMFWMRWLTENVGPKKRGHTEAEGLIAVAWANKMTKETLDAIAKWKKDGSPKERKLTKIKKAKK